MDFVQFYALAAKTEALQDPAKRGLNNIVHGDFNGFLVAATGLLIVFLALTLISVFISLLPKILDALAFMLPAEHEHHSYAPAARQTSDNEKIAAAVGFVLHEIHSKQP
ncbi:OadG family protein [Symmachiella dynata]|uniref:Oxaloacetate decarboxylase, gamma chain n=1 Tax=Symmachiella dynata TaxID=2527995 RepID=A0A517ZPQ7_9PLAN|nr:OadG family protein [Symmachiella dynata]QDU44476.1 Oxaloacetate decarboxylase, gamma chain [Symmachiella dynata]|tara:strand:- start:172 stop:498 length:327 start_codon:yes stop_codon:yes gene_type:complete